jgi:hypothetical protein
MEEISVILDLVETEVGWKSFASAGRYLAIYIPALKPPRGHGGRAKLWTYGVAALP